MSNIKVGVKVIPHNKRSNKEGYWMVTDDNTIHSFLYPCNKFTFDHKFGPKCLNADVYSSIVDPVVKSSLNGCNGTILMYGPTSPDKNYTMMGTETDEDPGIVRLAIKQLFKREDYSSDLDFKIRVSYIEIYKETIYDLLNTPNTVKIYPHGNLDVKEVLVGNYEETNKTLIEGAEQRRKNNKNELSSRSHSIFQITIESKNTASGIVRVSYLKFVYVAGSEVVSDTHLNTQLKKADHNNGSVLWLNSVVKELSEGNMNIDFCNSTLTQLIKESLTGRHNTAIICCIRTDVATETTFADQAQKVQVRHFHNQTDQPTESFIKIKEEFSHFEIERKRGLDMETDYHPPCKRVKRMSSSSSLSTEMKFELYNNSSDGSPTPHPGNHYNEVVNSLLKCMKELDEVKKAHQEDRKSLGEQREASKLAEEKFDDMKNNLEQQIENCNTSKKVLLAKVEASRKKIQEMNDLLRKKEKDLSSYNEIQLQNENLKSKNDFLSSCSGYMSMSNEIKMLKNNATQIMIVPGSSMGRIMGPKGRIIEELRHTTGVKISVSDCNGDRESDRIVTINNGTVDKVLYAVALIKKMINPGDVPR